MRSIFAPLNISLALLIAGASVFLVSDCIAGEKTYSPYAEPEFPRNVYWGDMHVHTELSMDANSMGNRLGQDEAYRFARGETVVSSTGVPMRLSRPLDFVELADHAEFMGIFPLVRNGDRRALRTGWGRYFQENDDLKLLFTLVGMTLAEDVQAKAAELGLRADRNLLQDVWRQVTATAERYNEPGRFTAFIGYEWTSSPRGDNLHRNVVFRDGAELAAQVLPFSSMDSQNPEDLWRHLEGYEEKTGGRALAIPHNGNLSNGLMFSDKSFAGEKLTRDYVETRLRWEPLVEVTQIKGDGESHPLLSPDDEFARFELWDTANLGFAVPKEDWMLQYEYAREALKLGLEIQSGTGANPFVFGMIGSSDTHTSLAAMEENNFSGKFAALEPGPRRIGQSTVPGKGDSAKGQATLFAAAGYAAVWARENTREALFDAMRRRETYATTGPRMMVRFFGGWDFQVGDDKRSDFAAIGYRRGVPMGGELSAAPAGRSPRFLVLAGKDPMAAHLDRIQIVKGWLDSDGARHERIYDVALSDGREVNPATGKALVVGSTVDVNTATYSNSIGAAVLSAVWEDPDFDPQETAFYYARVIEIPTPRWSTYEAVLYGVELPQDVPSVIQERAYTSPVWYKP